MSFIRQTALRQARLFSTTPVARKTMVDSIKETADAVNKKIGQVAAEGIQKTQDTTSSISNSTTEENVGAAKGSAESAMGQASGKASEMQGQMSGKASEMAGKAKGMAEEAKSKM